MVNAARGQTTPDSWSSDGLAEPKGTDSHELPLGACGTSKDVGTDGALPPVAGPLPPLTRPALRQAGT